MRELTPLQVIPPGLTGFLQLKQLGVGIGSLSDVLTGVMELREWFFTGRREVTASLFGAVPNLNIATGTPGNFFFTASGGVVPQREYWWVDHMTVFCTLNAADTVSFAPAINPYQGTDFVLVGPKTTDTITARARVCACTNERGFFVGPGDAFGFSLFDTLSAVQTNFQLRVIATRLPA